MELVVKSEVAILLFVILINFCLHFLCFRHRRVQAGCGGTHPVMHSGIYL
jgi:hypothetical protein